MDTEINLRAKKSEPEWQRVIDAFWKKATPQWFDWLEWILILAAIAYVAQKTHSFALKLVSGLSYAMLFLYFQSLFFSFKFKGLPLKSNKIRRFASFVISALLTATAWLLLTSLLTQLQGQV